MTDFKPRMGSYVKERNGQFFYRRAIPSAFREHYDGKTEWNIRLEGRTPSERLSEAHAYAHQHNREMEFGIVSRVLTGFKESQTPDGPDLSLRLDFSKFPLPKGHTMQPFRMHRDGQIVETFKVALSRDPDYLRAAQHDGYFAMSYDEGARPEEICQLRLVDVNMANLTVSITNDDSDDEPELRGRFTKNENSVRVVPIHSKLSPIVEAHLEVRKALGAGPLLFPSFAPQNEKGRYGRTISQEWTGHLRKLITNSRRKVLYSLRHAWKAESLAIGMPEHVRLALMGHGGDNRAAERYARNADWMDEKRRYVEMMDCIEPTKR